MDLAERNEPSTFESGSARPALAAAGGLLGGVAATACCIVPLALFSLGVGGVWIGRLAALSPWQPYFAGFAALSIAYGFWQVYGPRGDCADAGACARPLPRRLVKGALWTSSALVLSAVAYPYVLPFLL